MKLQKYYTKIRNFFSDIRIIERVSKIFISFVP